MLTVPDTVLSALVGANHFIIPLKLHNDSPRPHFIDKETEHRAAPGVLRLVSGGVRVWIACSPVPEPGLLPSC